MAPIATIFKGAFHFVDSSTFFFLCREPQSLADWACSSQEQTEIVAQKDVRPAGRQHSRDRESNAPRAALDRLSQNGVGHAADSEASPAPAEEVRPPMNDFLKWAHSSVLFSELRVLRRARWKVTFHTACSTAFRNRSQGRAQSPGPDEECVAADKLRSMLAISTVS